jgi:GT2 family glycosyltransferase
MRSEAQAAARPTESTGLPERQLGPSDVAIVVPIGGAAPAWQRCSKSLARLDPAPGELIVVIDGPYPDLAARASEIGAEVLQLEDRGGPARARNRGAQAARGDILFFVDSDVELPRDITARVAELFAADAGLAAVMGSYDDAPGDAGFFSQYRNLLHHYVHQRGREAASTFWAGCGAIRRRTFLEVGGFDDGYGVPSIEDIELGSRLRRSGHGIRLVKDLQVRHLKKWRLVDMLRTDLLRRAAPWTELMLREGQMVNDLNVTIRDRLSVVLAFVLLLALPAAALWPPALVLSAAAMLLLVVLNAGFFGFLLRRRGFLFTVAAIPAYWLYLLTCGFGFALGLLRHHLRRRPSFPQTSGQAADD